MGGVARNIAEGLARLLATTRPQTQVEFISALGQDAHGGNSYNLVPLSITSHCRHVIITKHQVKYFHATLPAQPITFYSSVSIK